MSKRKILLLAAALCMIAILAVGGTLAYFTDTSNEKDNVFTVGNVDIILEEPEWDSTGKEDAPEVYPGEALAKDPTVTNEGANPCFVRVSVDGLDCLDPEDPNMLIHVRTAGVLDALGEGWVLHTDGYYYYEKVLGVGESTTPVFDHIVIPTALTNGDGSEFHIYVQAYAVQAQGALPSFEAVKEMKVDAIADWFTVCGF